MHIDKVLLTSMTAQELSNVGLQGIREALLSRFSPSKPEFWTVVVHVRQQALYKGLGTAHHQKIVMDKH